MEHEHHDQVTERVQAKRRLSPEPGRIKHYLCLNLVPAVIVRLLPSATYDADGVKLYVSS